MVHLAQALNIRAMKKQAGQGIVDLDQGRTKTPNITDVPGTAVRVYAHDNVDVPGTAVRV